VSVGAAVRHAAQDVTVTGARSRPAGLTVIAVLALVQAGVGIFWGIRWFHLAFQLGERGALLLPLAGALVALRAIFALVIAALYLTFLFGVFARRDWAWSVGMVAVVLNLLGILALLLTGDTLVLVAVRGLVALVILVYLVSAAGRRALGATPSG
jgi:hypothetical protein